MRGRGRSFGESLGKLLMGSKLYKNTIERAAFETWRLGSAIFAKEDCLYWKRKLWYAKGSF